MSHEQAELRYKPIYEQARVALKAANVPFMEQRFPFTYHHDFIRSGNQSRADIGMRVAQLEIVLGTPVIDAMQTFAALASVCAAAPIPFMRALIAPASPLAAIIRECIGVWDANESAIRKHANGLWAELPHSWARTPE